MSDGMTFRNPLSAVLRVFMAIVRHYSRYPVRWRLQAERGNNTHRLHYQAFIDFGCNVKMRTVLHWMPEGTHLEPVRDTPEDVRRAADYCVKDATRCADDDEDLDMQAGPYSYGFGDDFDANNKLRAMDVCDDAAPHACARTQAGEYYNIHTTGTDAISTEPAASGSAAIASSPASGMDARTDASGDDAISTEPEAIASPANGITQPSIEYASIAGTSSTEPEAEAIDGMTDDDFRLMAEAFARPYPDESQWYLETMLLGVKRCR